MDKLEERNGYLYITSEWSCSDKPIMTKHWYPVSDGEGSRLSARGLDEYLGKEVLRDLSGTHYIKLRYPHRRIVHLLKGGQTTPDFTEQTPIACPKVRKGTKVGYRNGHWAKYLKTEGWVAITIAKNG